ncbi:MAG: DUF4870 domain-containing protein [Chloroflexi bacterium]|nr:DUF4870 domain-containing protein [Chloroflexota bacterium]
MTEANRKTSIGLEANIAGVLCYVAGWVSGLVFLVIEKENDFVRFHAMQSTAFFGAVTVVSILLGFIPIIGWIIGWLIGVLAVVMWIVLMMKAYQGQKMKLPIAGDFAEKQTARK